MAIDPVSASLLRLDVFQGLKPLQITEIARRAERIVYKPGQILIEDGAAGDAAVIVVAGEAVRTRAPMSANDVEEAIEPGSMLGEMAMLIETDYTSTVIAKGAVRALRITREAMLAMMLEDPSLADHLVAKMARRLEDIASDLRRIDGILAGTPQDEAAQTAAPNAQPPPLPATATSGDSAPAPQAAAPAAGGIAMPARIVPASLSMPTLNIVPQRF